jgi:hypothetical protein
MDTQIQPAADNLLASKMAVEVAKVLPEFTSVIDFSKPDMHYIKTFRVKEGDKFVSRGTNLYWPIAKNDIFEYHPEDTIYQSTREDLNGTHGEGPQKRFLAIWEDDMSEWNGIKARHESWKNRK